MKPTLTIPELLARTRLAELNLKATTVTWLDLRGVDTPSQVYALVMQYKKYAKMDLMGERVPWNELVDILATMKNLLQRNGLYEDKGMVGGSATNPEKEDKYTYKTAAKALTAADRAKLNQPKLVETNLPTVNVSGEKQLRLAQILAENKARLPNFTDINSLKEARATYLELYEIQRTRLTDMNLKFDTLIVFVNASKVSKATPKLSSILVRYAEEAFSKNLDLNISSWRKHLLALLNKPELISITPMYAGDVATKKVDLTSFKVDIESNLTSVLGSIEDYGEAVRGTRNRLHYGNQVFGSRASRLWFRQLWQVARGGGGVMLHKISDKTYEVQEVVDKHGTKRKVPKITKVIYRQAKQGEQRVKENREAKLSELYYNIMSTRLELMANKAPYWYLLNYGSASAGNISKGGGTYAAPSFQPTMFVQKAEAEIAKLLLDKYNASVKLPESIKLTEKKIAVIKEVLDLLEELIRDIERGPAEVIYNKSLEMVITKVNLAFANAIAASNEDTRLKAQVVLKAELLANQILAEENTGRRIYLFTKQKREYRPRTSALAKQILEQLKKDLAPDDLVRVTTVAKGKVAVINNKLKSIKEQLN